MGKRLKIEYGDELVVDGEPWKVVRAETGDGVIELHVEMNPPPPGPSRAEQAAQLMQQLQKQGAGGVAGKEQVGD